MALTGVLVAPGVHRLGTSLVNIHLVEEAGRYTLVDAGLPGYFDATRAAIERLGADLHDVEAVVLTHAHADHVGFAERMRSEAQAKVLIHQADAQAARSATSPPREGSVKRYLWHPATLRLLLHFARNGVKPPRVADVTTFSDGAVLDVPGRPRAIHTPGHSYGHCAVHFADHGVLIAGDALNGRNPLTGRAGPQVPPAALNVSTEQALRSLERLRDVDAPVVAFGHGDPWTQGAGAAVERALAAGPS